MQNPTQRQLRIGELVKRLLAQALLEGNIRNFEDAGKRIIISQVSMSGDLKRAVCFVALLNRGPSDEMCKALAKAAPSLRHHLAQQMSLRTVPVLVFKPDNLNDKIESMERIFSGLRTPSL